LTGYLALIEGCILLSILSKFTQRCYPFIYTLIVPRFTIQDLTPNFFLRGLGAALRTRYNFSHEQVVADTLRMFGQGIKVCVEIAAMAADAGLIPAGDVIAVGGTGRGADTAAVIAADFSNRFFNIKVREILAKPVEF
jgi:uncharacterized protein